MTGTTRDDDTAYDGVLIQRWKGGDERAATEIVERHAPALTRFAAQLGVRSDVDELVQDTFVRAFNALEGFRAESSLRTWLFTILRRLVIDRRRAMGRRAVEVDVAEHDASTEYDALDGLVAEETSLRIRRAMDKLSPMQREVFILRVQEGRNYKDIAEILGSSEGAARVHYHNVMRTMKEALDD